jgi:hypothetical protein
MRLSILLFLLNLKLKRAAKKNPAFAARLKKKDYTAVIRTADFKVGRYFIFCGGNLISKNGCHDSPDIELVWDDAGFAFRTLLKGDEIELMQAMGKSKLKLEGNLGYFYWFTDTLDHMAGI